MDTGFALLGGHFFGASFVVWLIDWLKRTPGFTLLTEETKRLNQAAAVIGAAITAAGIHFAFEPQALQDAAGHYRIAIDIAGLTFANFLHFVGGFGVSITTQQFVLKVYQIAGALRKLSDTDLPALRQGLLVANSSLEFVAKK
jgi:hypothetical protein